MACEAILTRAFNKVQGKEVAGAEWLAILLPILLEALQKFLSECDFTPQQLANACTKIRLVDRVRLTRHFLAAIWDVRGVYGMSLKDVLSASRAAAQGITEEAEVTAATPEGQKEIETAAQELQQAA